MSDTEKTGFAAIDEKAKATDPSPADVSEANTQAKNEHTETKDDTLGLTAPNVPENLQTTSAHRNDEANANTIAEVKAGHDAALAELRDGMTEMKQYFEGELLKLSNKFKDLTTTANDTSDDGSLSTAVEHRFKQLERAVGIRADDPVSGEESGA